MDKLRNSLLPAALLPLAAVASGEAPTPPNVVVIYVDDLGYADVSAYPHASADVHTPHIDAIAENGVLMTKGYVTSPMCGPSRAALVTGRYQQRIGYELHWGPGAVARDPEVDFGLPAAEPTIAHHFQGLGYRTFAFGKWHLGNSEAQLPHNKGFDEYYGIIEPGNQLHLTQEHIDYGLTFWDDQVDAKSEEMFLTELYTDKAIDFVNRHKDDPFFMYLSYTAVHAPTDAAQRYHDQVADIEVSLPEEYQSNDPRYHVSADQRRSLLAMLAELDDNVGRFMTQLERHGLSDNTLLFFISDNGGKPGNNASYNLPLNGQKGQLLEGGIHVPYLMQWPAQLPKGLVYDHPVLQIDVLPTALAAAGGQAPEVTDGVNLLPHLQGKHTTKPHEALFWRTGHNWAVQQDDWKLVHSARDFFLKPKGEPALYYLGDDPSEQENLIQRFPERAETLQKLWDQWNQDNVTPLFGPPNLRPRYDMPHNLLDPAWRERWQNRPGQK
ncbi:sulfatase family protein [Ferrimonas pelagia]|uniref:Sulfatase N-terminal domain-containing protein n=1 Tax=Ferrimonas pelagia TaxID=1177826 RepID=A0ABP9FI31_9GAMM